MKIKRNKLHQILVIALVVLCVSLVSVCDCFMCDQIVDSLDHCEWENHSFVLNSLEEKIPNSITNLPLEPHFPLIAVTASQVFHPPAIV
jgi:hypothetical protein